MKSFIFFGFICLSLISCSKKYDPTGCWTDNESSLIQLEKGGIATCSYSWGKSIPGKWTVLKDNTLNIDWDYDRRSTTEKIANIEDGLMILGNSGFQYSWKKIDCN